MDVLYCPFGQPFVQLLGIKDLNLIGSKGIEFNIALFRLDVFTFDVKVSIVGSGSERVFGNIIHVAVEKVTQLNLVIGDAKFLPKLVSLVH